MNHFIHVLEFIHSTQDELFSLKNQQLPEYLLEDLRHCTPLKNILTICYPHFFAQDIMHIEKKYQLLSQLRISQGLPLRVRSPKNELAQMLSKLHITLAGKTDVNQLTVFSKLLRDSTLTSHFSREDQAFFSYDFINLIDWALTHKNSAHLVKRLSTAIFDHLGNEFSLLTASPEIMSSLQASLFSELIVIARSERFLDEILHSDLNELLIDDWSIIRKIGILLADLDESTWFLIISKLSTSLELDQFPRKRNIQEKIPSQLINQFTEYAFIHHHTALLRQLHKIGFSESTQRHLQSLSATEILLFLKANPHDSVSMQWFMDTIAPSFEDYLSLLDTKFLDIDERRLIEFLQLSRAHRCNTTVCHPQNKDFFSKQERKLIYQYIFSHHAVTFLKKILRISPEHAKSFLSFVHLTLCHFNPSKSEQILGERLHNEQSYLEILDLCLSSAPHQEKLNLILDEMGTLISISSLIASTVDILIESEHLLVDPEEILFQLCQHRCHTFEQYCHMLLELSKKSQQAVEICIQHTINLAKNLFKKQEPHHSLGLITPNQNIYAAISHQLTNIGHISTPLGLSQSMMSNDYSYLREYYDSVIGSDLIDHQSYQIASCMIILTQLKLKSIDDFLEDFRSYHIPRTVISDILVYQSIYHFESFIQNHHLLQDYQHFLEILLRLFSYHNKIKLEESIDNIYASLISEDLLKNKTLENIHEDLTALAIQNRNSTFFDKLVTLDKKALHIKALNTIETAIRQHQESKDILYYTFLLAQKLKFHSLDMPLPIENPDFSNPIRLLAPAEILNEVDLIDNILKTTQHADNRADLIAPAMEQSYRELATQLINQKITLDIQAITTLSHFSKILLSIFDLNPHMAHQFLYQHIDLTQKLTASGDSTAVKVFQDLQEMIESFSNELSRSALYFLSDFTTRPIEKSSSSASLNMPLVISARPEAKSFI